jgi:hypothetical protein
VPAPSSAVPPLSLPAPGRRAAWPPGTRARYTHGFGSGLLRAFWRHAPCP